MNLAEAIMETATKDTKMDPLLGPGVIGVEETIPDNLIVSVEQRLDFWNEISGFFHSNVNNHRVITTGDKVPFEVPDDVKVYTGWTGPYKLGDYIVTSDYIVYLVHGRKE